MTTIRRSILAILVGGAMLAGAVVGAIGFSGIAANAASTPTGGAARNADATAAPGTATGVFVSNEDPAHEATESAEREAQEEAGQRPAVP
jgi:hypothetical protein